ncbi:MAG: hypothetical protein JEZ03_16375, partial [Bacteroidales bacterium]|nr:hypothetical protein [Bacteroidales bacterium]
MRFRKMWKSLLLIFLLEILIPQRNVVADNLDSDQERFMQLSSQVDNYADTDFKMALIYADSLL